MDTSYLVVYNVDPLGLNGSEYFCRGGPVVIVLRFVGKVLLAILKGIGLSILFILGGLCHRTR